MTPPAVQPLYDLGPLLQMLLLGAAIALLPLAWIASIAPRAISSLAAKTALTFGLAWMMFSMTVIAVARLKSPD